MGFALGPQFGDNRHDHDRPKALVKGTPGPTTGPCGLYAPPGVALATALLASGPLSIDTAVDVALRRALLSAGRLAAHLRLVTYAL
jgi:hypothetical protein